MCAVLDLLILVSSKDFVRSIIISGSRIEKWKKEKLRQSHLLPSCDPIPSLDFARLQGRQQSYRSKGKVRGGTGRR